MSEPESMTTFLGDAGACPEIHCDGKVWTLGHPSQRAKSCLEQQAASRALANVRELGDEALEAATLMQIQQGHFKTWAPGWQNVVFADANSDLFMLSLLREKHPNATPDDVRRIAEESPLETRAALAQVVPGFFVYLLEPVKKRLTPDQLKAIETGLATLRQSLTQETDLPTSSTA